MSSLDEAMQAAERKNKSRTQLDVILEALDPKDADRLLKVYLPDRRYTAPQISRALATLGYTISRGAISDWRAKHVPR